VRELRRKTLIPAFVLTEICNAEEPGAVERSIVAAADRQALTYYLKPVSDSVAMGRQNYNLFPVILTKNSVPWDLGMLFILRRLETERDPDMSTIASLAGDLGVYREWLDDQENPDELLISFPKMKLRRVTYRYKGALKKKVDAGEIAVSSAKRQMGVVIAFYRWLIKEQIFVPSYDPWEEREYKLNLKNSYGGTLTKKVKSTDLKIDAPKADDSFDGTIQDDGKLRPLPLNEQQWVMDAAHALGNGEMYFIILFMMLTGARMQTVCTLKLRHFSNSKGNFSSAVGSSEEVFKISAGPGTGIDTKRNKRGVLHVPRALYEALNIYANSDRARRRRNNASGGDHGDQYLFLTQQGSPYYMSKKDAQLFDPDLKRRHRKNGGTVRQFLNDRLIPYIRENHDVKFHFRPHDLRATFGMSQTEIQMELVHVGIISLARARTNVMALMWHASSKTTDLYLDYKANLKATRAAVDNYGGDVQKWISQGMAGDWNQ